MGHTPHAPPLDFEISEHHVGQNESGMIDDHSSARTQPSTGKMNPGVVLVAVVPW